MCYICKCCGWLLDVIQRVLTFCMACVMCASICVGVCLAIGAGIAYGYNFMLAEFLSISRSDLAVYVRRGEFYDKPDLGKGRRSGDAEDLFSSNASDYQDINKQVDNSKPLSDSLNKALNSRKYSQKLNKYSDGNIQREPMYQRIEAKPFPLRTTYEEPAIYPTRVPSRNIVTRSDMLDADYSVIPFRTTQGRKLNKPKIRVRVQPMQTPVRRTGSRSGLEMYEDQDEFKPL